MTIPFFEKFFSNVFHVKNVIDSRLQAFARFVIAALTGNNPNNVFDPVILTLTNAYNTYFGNYNAKTIDKSDATGYTVGIVDAIQAFINGVHEDYHAIAAAFPVGSMIYKQFFPKGLTEFNHVTRDNILQLSNRLKLKANQYKSQLGGAPFAARYAGFDADIVTNLDTQNTSDTTVKAVIGKVKTSRLPVENALITAMYAVGYHFFPDITKCHTYFDFSLLYGDGTNPTVLKLGTVLAHTSLLCIGDLIVPKSIFTLKNKSDLPQQYFAAHVLNGAMVGMAIDLPAHTEKEVPFAGFGSADMLFLYVKNSTDFAGKWEVSMQVGK